MTRFAGWGVVLGVLILVVFASTAAAGYTLSTAPWNTLPFTDFKSLEAVDSTGTQTYGANAFQSWSRGLCSINPPT